MLGHGTTCLEGVQLACGYTGGFGPVNCTYVWSPRSKLFSKTPRVYIRTCLYDVTNCSEMGKRHVSNLQLDNHFVQ